MRGQATSKQIARFVTEEVRPRLAPDFASFKSRDLVRMRGAFTQLLAFSKSRNGTLRVHPTFFVVGADLSLPVIPQNVSLEVLDPRKWSFPEVTLDGAFAERLVHQLEHTSPLPWRTPLAALDATALSRLFLAFDRQTAHWSACLYLAYDQLSRADPDAAATLRRARAKFDRLGLKVLGAPPAWRLAMDQRLIDLQHRLSLADGRDLCRAEAEAQAKVLGLPPILWD